MQQQRIETVGKLGSTYGIRGWLRIYSSTEQAESIFDYQPWFLKIKGQWQLTEPENWRHHNHELIVKLKGVDDREAAQILANVEIGVDLSVFPQLEEGDYYWHDLIGSGRHSRRTGAQRVQPAIASLARRVGLRHVAFGRAAV